MKVFISADIEGVATTLSHEDCRPGNPNYPYHCDEMTKEVLAACEGAMEAGADEIVIKDAHGPACNIDSKVLPPLCPDHQRLVGASLPDGGGAGQEL